MRLTLAQRAGAPTAKDVQDNQHVTRRETCVRRDACSALAGPHSYGRHTFFTVAWPAGAAVLRQSTFASVCAASERPRFLLTTALQGLARTGSGPLKIARNAAHAALRTGGAYANAAAAAAEASSSAVPSSCEGRRDASCGGRALRCALRGRGGVDRCGVRAAHAAAALRGVRGCSYCRCFCFVVTRRRFSDILQSSGTSPEVLRFYKDSGMHGLDCALDIGIGPVECKRPAHRIPNGAERCGRMLAGRGRSSKRTCCASSLAAEPGRARYRLRSGWRVVRAERGISTPFAEPPQTAC